MEVFEHYLANMDDAEHRNRTEKVLAWVTETFPTLVPAIKWNQPVFSDHGTYIIGFSTAKKHLAVAPENAAIEHFSEEIAHTGYDCTKEIFRIKWNSPVDFTLLEKVIEFNRQDKADCSSFWRK
ncbi:iron chaperone [Planococcus salinus]|uniref:Iron chaperone n=1 Tax=Planococcus salinus TaxID=1848460 RepID=A0A3M8P316_9BACL|nr:iron chaperone [Planococcus salinus]RNF38123.1 iron chaperone [Planococcus salinus]